MQMLIKDTRIIAIGEEITYGLTDVYEPDVEKWKVYNPSTNSVCFWIDGGFTLVNGVTIPSDYQNGKYSYENGEFVLNKEWRPFVPTEKRVTQLEEDNKRLTQENLDSTTIEADLLYELSLLQLGLL